MRSDVGVEVFSVVMVSGARPPPTPLLRPHTRAVRLGHDDVTARRFC